MFYLYKASFCCLGKGHVYEGSGERLCVHLAARPLQVLDLPLLHVGAGGARPHREQVRHHAAEPRRQAGLGYETKLELSLGNNTHILFVDINQLLLCYQAYNCISALIKCWYI